MRLPRLQVPPGTLLLREELAGGPDRSGNSRLLIRDDGAILHARNEALWAERDDDDPAAHWNTPLQPVGSLSAEQVAALVRAVEQVRFDEAATPTGPVSDPVFERVTAVRGGEPVTVAAERGAVPAPLRELRETVDTLVEAALRAR